MSDNEILAIKRRAEKYLLALPGVHAVGLGSKVTKGIPTGELSIRVYVLNKKLPEVLPRDQRIPSEIEGVPTDVVESPVHTIDAIVGADPTAKLDDPGRYRPLIGGTQIQRRNGPLVGTLGCFCTVDGNVAKIIALTNHHVFYERASDVPNHEVVGQPTDQDSCTKCCSDIIGTVLDAQCDSDVDIALVELRSGEKWLREILNIGTVKGIDSITIDVARSRTYQVKKRGRTTQLTGGFVFDANLTGTIFKKDGSVYRQFQAAIGVKGNPDPANAGTRVFTKSGDSGCAVLNTSDKVIGIEFGSTAQGPEGPHSLVMPIQVILNKFSSQVDPARRITLAVATATTLNDIQTVPAAVHSAPALPVDLIPEAVEDSPQILHGARLQLELGESQLGQLWSRMYMLHSREVRQLLDTNRRFATLWHRGGGAGLFQCLLRAFHNPEVRIPERISDRGLNECIDSVAEAVSQFGSTELKRDLRQLLPNVPDIAGRTYPEILVVLKTLDNLKVSHTA